ncbi:hypothetical protein HK405_012294 [Cladochytrium tenue]|nr:hypothetical protein HK405_012294 [Cladochytrium tenue]
MAANLQRRPLTFTELAARSDSFHRRVPFPTASNRIKVLADSHRRLPNSDATPALPSVADSIATHAAATRVVLHSRVLTLIDNFLALKLCTGSHTEHAVYQSLGWSARAFVERLFLRRALVFLEPADRTSVVRFGPTDAAGEREILGVDYLGPALRAWELVGSDLEDPKLRMEDYLTYHEMQISALIGVSVPTYFINRGQRDNRSIPADPTKDPFVSSGVYIGLVGARFENILKMEREYCLVEEGHSTQERGFGQRFDHLLFDRAVQALRAVRSGLVDVSSAATIIDSKLANVARMHMWARFLELGTDDGNGIPSQNNAILPAFQPSRHSRSEISSAVSLPVSGFAHKAYLNVAAYLARIRISAETLLMEASDRAAEAGTANGTAAPPVYVHVVGLGLGVWQVHRDQPAMYVRAFGDSILSLVRNRRIPHIAVVDFSWVNGVAECAGASHGQRVRVNQGGTGGDSNVYDGPEIRFSRRNPADPLPRPPHPSQGGEAGEYLLVACYAWDSNSFPGNEYWSGMLSSSGDPAAACCSTIAELQNPYINPYVEYGMRVLDPVSGFSII